MFTGRQARNRWLVAYTLLRNPSLQGLAANRLKENKDETFFMKELLPDLEKDNISLGSKAGLVYSESSNL